MAFNEKTIIYILITIVLLGGTYFGITTTYKIQTKQNTVTLNKFLLDMDSSIKTTKDNFGKVSIDKFKLPPDAIFLCFIDLKNPSTNFTEIEEFPLVIESAKSGIEKNMFIVWSGLTESYYNPFVRLNNKTLCIENPKDNIIELKFSGNGNSTKIELNQP